MTLSGSEFHWTPTSGDVGNVNVSLALSSGNIERLQTLAFRVTRGGIRLPFDATDVALSHDGNLALVAKSIQMNPGDPTQAEAGGSTRLAIVDTAMRKTLASRSLTVGISALAIDEDYAYVALSESEAFYALSRKDLSDVKRVFTRGDVTRIIPGTDSIVVQTRTGSIIFVRKSDFSVIQTPASHSADNPDGPTSVRIPNGEMNSIVDLDETILANGLVFDRSLQRVIMARHLEGFREGRLGADRRPETSHPLWGVAVDARGNLIKSQRNFNLQMAASASLILPTQPAAVVLFVTNRPTGGEEADLQFRDLLTGRVQFKLPIDEEGQSNRNGIIQPGMGRSNLLAIAAGKVAVVQRGMLYVIKVPPLAADKFPEPLHFKFGGGVPVVSDQKPTVLTCVAAGSDQPYEFELAQEIPGVDINKTTGTITIEPKALDATALDALTRDQGLLANLAGYLKSVTPRFRALTGSEPHGIPVAVTLVINVHDNSVQTAQMNQIVLVDLPASMVNEAAAKLSNPQPAAVAYSPYKHLGQPGAGPTTEPSSNTDQKSRRWSVVWMCSRPRSIC